jgi:hypothetical protein
VPPLDRISGLIVLAGADRDRDGVFRFLANSLAGMDSGNTELARDLFQILPGNDEPQPVLRFRIDGETLEVPIGAPSKALNILRPHEHSVRTAEDPRHD